MHRRAGIAEASVINESKLWVILSIGNHLALCRASHVPSIAQASLTTDDKTIDIVALLIDVWTEQGLSLTKLPMING